MIWGVGRLSQNSIQVDLLWIPPSSHSILSALLLSWKGINSYSWFLRGVRRTRYIWLHLFKPATLRLLMHDAGRRAEIYPQDLQSITRQIFSSFIKCIIWAMIWIPETRLIMNRMEPARIFLPLDNYHRQRAISKTPRDFAAKSAWFPVCYNGGWTPG
jgi:hypothetical protein